MKKLVVLTGCILVILTSDAQRYTIDDLTQTLFLYPDFYKGKAVLKDKSAEEAIFNYNTFFQQMIFVQNGTMLALDKVSAIDTVYVDTLLFVPVDTIFYEVKLPHSSLPLFVNYRAEIKKSGPVMPFGGESQTGAVQNVLSHWLSAITPYQLKIPDTYEVRKFAEYYIRPADEFVQLKNLKQLKQLYPANEDQLSKFVKQNHISFNTTADMEKLASFLATIKR